MATYQATSKAADAPNIEAAMYDLVLVSVEPKRIKGGQFTKDTVNGDPKLELGYNVVSNDDEDPGLIFGEDGDAVVVNKLVGVGFNTQSKTTPSEVLWLKATLTKAEYAAFENGEGTPDDEAQAPEGLLGRVVQGEVFIKENGWPGVGTLVAPKGGQKGKPYSGVSATYTVHNGSLRTDLSTALVADGIRLGVLYGGLVVTPESRLCRESCVGCRNWRNEVREALADEAKAKAFVDSVEDSKRLNAWLDSFFLTSPSVPEYIPHAIPYDELADAYRLLAESRTILLAGDAPTNILRALDTTMFRVLDAIA